MSQALTFDLPAAAATTSLARRVAGLVQPGDVLALSGDLGSGKTHFARGVIGALLEEGEEFIPSPTFTLVQTYPGRIAGQATEIWHFDLYRLRRPADVYELGWEEALAGGLVLVEWPEQLGALLPKTSLVVMLAPGNGPESRQARLSAGRGWEERLPVLAKEHHESGYRLGKG